jgi:hypothetical protein
MITAILENYFLKNILFEYILFLKLNLRRLSFVEIPVRSVGVIHFSIARNKNSNFSTGP